ncbi:UNVERIFIED_CONTAM: hypothetical protein Sangu_2030700 [Sesamum angustifolium]|uniref:Uncharacterized protein n=1 Tax=Sesamum angustifolium TaxID=2727405 RepID=A0AAW2LK14_9LAMI
MLDVEAMEDTPLTQFRRVKWTGPKNPHNDALVIKALLANYEIGHIFIDSGSSADILFGEAYDQIQLRDTPGEGQYLPVCFHGRISTSTRHDLTHVDHRELLQSKDMPCKFLVVDIPSAYNVILGRPTLNAF